MRNLRGARASTVWGVLEIKDAEDARTKAVMSGNREAVEASEKWLEAIQCATVEQVERAAMTCSSIAPYQRQRTHEALGYHKAASQQLSKAELSELGR